MAHFFSKVDFYVKIVTVGVHGYWKKMVKDGTLADQVVGTNILGAISTLIPIKSLQANILDSSQITILGIFGSTRGNRKGISGSAISSREFEENIRQKIITIDMIRILHRNAITSKRLYSEDLNVHRDSKDNHAITPFDFSEANLKRLSAIIQNYPEGAQRSALGAAMDIVQRQIGWIPISAMHKVAEVLSVPRMRVYEWATFYSMNKRRYRGKFNVKVCVTTPCMLRGADDILQVVEETTCCCAGGVSPDFIFSVDKVQCQGACVNAPVIVVDDDYYEDVTVCDVHNIIQTLKCGGIPPWGPQSGRFACEPITGQTTLLEDPPPPGFGIQQALLGGPNPGPSKPSHTSGC